MNIPLSSPSPPPRETLEKMLPFLLAFGLAWIAARGVKKLVWSSLGLYWAFHWTHAWRWFH